MTISLKKLKTLAAQAGVEQIGAVAAVPQYYLKERLQRRAEAGRVTPFEENDPAKRIYPERLLDGCRSIVTLALPYAAPQSDQPRPANEPYGAVARCAQGLDYHLLVERKAEAVVALLKKETGAELRVRILVDRNPLVEKELASQSGLGIIGENCLLQTPRYGSFVALGVILLTGEIEYDAVTEIKTASRRCLSCGKCRAACPTGALLEPFMLDPYRCLSYQTQASGIIPASYRSLLGNRLYGCDRCQEVCPANETAAPSPFPEAAFSFFPAEPLLLPLLRMTQKEFSQTIGRTAAGWRGKTTIQRNAVIALGNSGNTGGYRPLADLLETDPRPVIRLHAAWALGRLGGDKARYSLEKSRRSDPEDMVVMEVNRALEVMAGSAG